LIADPRLGVAFLALGHFKHAIDNFQKSTELDVPHEDDETTLAGGYAGYGWQAR
jgi:hypothetical protein